MRARYREEANFVDLTLDHVIIDTSGIAGEVVYDNNCVSEHRTLDDISPLERIPTGQAADLIEGLHKRMASYYKSVTSNEANFIMSDRIKEELRNYIAKLKNKAEKTRMTGIAKRKYGVLVSDVSSRIHSIINRSTGLHSKNPKSLRSEIKSFMKFRHLESPYSKLTPADVGVLAYAYSAVIDFEQPVAIATGDKTIIAAHLLVLKECRDKDFAKRVMLFSREEVLNRVKQDIKNGIIG